MSPHAWISVLITLAVFAALWRRGGPTDLLFLGGLMGVTVTGVISPAEALTGFANPAVITVGALFVVATGLGTTGVLDRIGNRLLGTARTVGQATLRITFTVLGVSAFVNNTPVVAMFVPVLLDWCRRRGISPSRLLIPLSYVAILGGTCTLIGTSTNIVVNGLLREQQELAQQQNLYTELPGFREQLHDMTMFEITQVGLPCAVIGAAYLVFFGYRLLPSRSGLIEQFGREPRQYLVEMLVQPECRLIGQTVQQAGLRHLRGLFLIEIDRQDRIITPATPKDVIYEGDRLVFSGVVTTIVDLVKIPGLVPAHDIGYATEPSLRQRHLAEAVVSRSSPLVGMTVRDANFRELYNAAVVAVHRNGSKLPSKIGDITLVAGDTLLLQTQKGFTDRFRHSRDFYLVASVEGSQPLRHDRAWVAMALFFLLVLWLTAASFIPADSLLSGLRAPAVAALSVAGLMVLTRCVPMAMARSSIDLQVLLTIGAALGLGRALAQSGAAAAIANWIVDGVGGGHPYLLLISLYLVAMILTEMITNTAVAATLFPLGVAMAEAGGYNPRPFVMAIAVAASLSFLTPIGYQTNLMVMGPGGYQPRDYLRFGWPLALLMAITALVAIPVVWPLQL